MSTCLFESGSIYILHIGLQWEKIRDSSNASIFSALWSWGGGLVPLSWSQIFWRRIALSYSNTYESYNLQLLMKMTWSKQVRELGRHSLPGEATKYSRVGQKWRDRMPCPDILNTKELRYKKRHPGHSLLDRDAESTNYMRLQLQFRLQPKNIDSDSNSDFASIPT